jgi:ABC-type nitrate/sulfonate/bicarbonate transport system substrate-binding protein
MDKMNIKIGGVPEHFNLPWRLAMEEGLLREHGIHLHWEDMGGGTGQMVRGLESKTLDVAVLLTEGISQAILKGLDAKIIQVYVTSSLHWGVHVPVESDIHSLADLEHKTFAISREGSGSHLMSYVMADEQGWDLESLKFEVVGDIYGGLWALDNNKAQGFLWEKYTTRPYTEQNKCRYVDEVVTPWPCFCIAVRNEVLAAHSEKLKIMCEVINKRAEQLKNSPDAAESISWRYNLMLEDVRNWLKETDWNYSGVSFEQEIKNTVMYLEELNLLNNQQTENWKEKLLVTL